MSSPDRVSVVKPGYYIEILNIYITYIIEYLMLRVFRIVSFEIWKNVNWRKTQLLLVYILIYSDYNIFSVVHIFLVIK